MSALDRQALVEKHLISQELAEQDKHGAVVIRDDEVVSIMVNEEDHLRIQVIMPGFRLHEAWKLANNVDNALECTCCTRSTKSMAISRRVRRMSEPEFGRRS